MGYSTTARPRRTGRLRLILCLGLMLAALTACKDDPRDEDPPDPEPPNNGEITGTFVTQDINAGVSDDPADNLGAGIIVIDQTHVPVQRQNLTDPSFSLMTELLEPPYVLELSDRFSGVTMRSVATGPGTVNITPLTDIVSALLLARAQPDGFIDPADYYENFGLIPRPKPGETFFPPPEPGPSDPSRINDTAIQRAQMQTRSALESFGVYVDPAIEDFITQPFEVADGDPMYDTIVDLVDTLRNRNLTLSEYKDQLLANDRICATVDKITVTVDGNTQLFCPSERTGTAVDEATTYRFSTLDGDTLSVTATGGMVSAATLEIGAGTFTCEGSACAGIGITDNDDQPGSRDVRFDGAMLADGMGSATLDGTLTAPPPGFPPLAVGCAGKPPFFFSTMGGVRASGCLAFAGFDNNFEGTRLFKILDSTLGGYDVTLALEEGDQVLFASVTPSFDNDNPPEDYIAFKCRRDEPIAPCSGISLTEPDADGLRNIRFDEVDLLGVDADGSLSSDAQATLTGVILTNQAEPLPVMPEPNSANNALVGRVSADCDALGVRDVLNVDLTDDGDWQLCVPDAYGPPQPGGEDARTIETGDDVVIYTFRTLFQSLDDSGGEANFRRGDSFSVVVDRDTREVRSARFSRNLNSNERYICGGAMPCSGISVSEPDAQDIVTIIADNTMLSEVQVFSPVFTDRGLPSLSTPESRSAVVNGRLSTRPCPGENSTVGCTLGLDLSDEAQADLAKDE